MDADRERAGSGGVVGERSDGLLNVYEMSRRHISIKMRRDNATTRS